MKNNLFRFTEGQTQFSTSWHAKLSLALNELILNVLCSNLHTTSKACPITYQTCMNCMHDNQLSTKNQLNGTHIGFYTLGCFLLKV